MTLDIVTIILLVVNIFVVFFTSYFQEKGKNLATLEDIQQITMEIEEIKIVSNKILADYTHENQLKLAAIDKRLEVHQKAFSLWRKVFLNVHNQEKLDTYLIECNDFWVNNCLYLSDKANQAFLNSLQAAGIHHILKEGRNKDEIISNWNIIIAAGTEIALSVQLPSVAKKPIEVRKRD